MPAAPVDEWVAPYRELHHRFGALYPVLRDLGGARDDVGGKA
ncbi:MAG: hypothetical protein ACYC91_15240 [Solirubrobacteraceae bacterium]